MNGPRSTPTSTLRAVAFRNRLVALGQLVTAPLLLIVFLVAEPGLVPEWAGYVGRCALCVVDGRQRW